MTLSTGSIARRALARAALAALPLLAGCGDGSVETITDVREGPATTDFRQVSTAERFGMSRGAERNPHHGMHGASATKFEWTTPEGFEEKVPPGPMREADFRLKRDPSVECYLSVAQGGIAANVIRWYAQMKKEPISPAAVANLPTEPFLGQKGILVDLEGTFVGMGREEPREGYRMLGLLVEEPGRTVTLKMTGPAAVVAEERGSFLELAKSFRAAAAPARPQGEGGLAWDVPEGWERGPDRAMRVVTFAPRDGEGAECYVTVLGGSGGGVDANLNRWREQMAQPPLGAADLAALETVKILGYDAKVIEVAGSFTDMQGNQAAEAGLLGAVCELPGALLTIKMTGPKAIVEKEKDRFLAFCRSLRTP